MIAKRVILGFFIALMALPMVNTIYPFIFSAGLLGAVTYADDTSFTLKGWWEGGYQEQKEKYLNDHYGFRPDFVRLHNQVEYSLYKKIHLRTVVEGKEHYLYEKAYIDSYYGNNFVGEDSLFQTARRLKGLQQILASNGKALIVAIAPGKGVMFPEYIPDNLKQEKRGKYNADILAGYFDSLGVQHIDINRWFITNRDKMEYPLMTKYNTHWSAYGAVLAIDTIVKAVERLTGKDLPDISFDCLECDTMVSNDREMMESMNLIWPWTQKIRTCIPDIHIADSGKAKIDALVLSDSFFWHLYYVRMPHRLFNYFEFWFYGNQAYGPDSFISNYDFENLKKIIDRSDVVIYLASENSADWYKWGLPDMYQALGDSTYH